MHSWEGYKKFAWGTDELMPQVFTSVLMIIVITSTTIPQQARTGRNDNNNNNNDNNNRRARGVMIIMIIIMITTTGAHWAQLAWPWRHYRRLDEHSGEISLVYFTLVH